MGILTHALTLSLSKGQRVGSVLPMPFYVYILQCSDGSYYTGHTDDLDIRMSQHSDGVGSAYTAKRRPLTLLWATDCQTREEAFELERRLHGWSRAKKEALMRGAFQALPALARSRSGPGAGADPSTSSLRQAQDRQVSARGAASINAEGFLGRVAALNLSPSALTLSQSKG